MILANVMVSTPYDQAAEYVRSTEACLKHQAYVKETLCSGTPIPLTAFSHPTGSAVCSHLRVIYEKH